MVVVKPLLTPNYMVKAKLLLTVIFSVAIIGFAIQGKGDFKENYEIYSLCGFTYRF
jgi:hypothetical protein